MVGAVTRVGEQVFQAAEGLLVKKYILCQDENGNFNLIGRFKKQRNGHNDGLRVEYLEGEPVIEGDKIISYKTRKTHGAHGKWLGSGGENEVWKVYNPLLVEAGL